MFGLGLGLRIGSFLSSVRSTQHSTAQFISCQDRASLLLLGCKARGGAEWRCVDVELGACGGSGSWRWVLSGVVRERGRQSCKLGHLRRILRHFTVKTLIIGPFR